MDKIRVPYKNDLAVDEPQWCMQRISSKTTTSVRTIRELLGHADVATTMFYAHVPRK